MRSAHIIPYDPAVTGALDRLRGLFRRDRAAVCADFTEWFWDYHQDLFSGRVPLARYERKAGAALRATGPGRLLDVGGGFGLHAVLLRALGAREVAVMELHDRKVLDAVRLAAHLGLDGIRVLHGDATAIPFRDGDFDGAVALACLSHIGEQGQALREIARVLKPGGVLYVFEDNNRLFPGYRRGMAPVWEEAERGRGVDGRPFEKVRRDMIRARFGDLPEADLDRHARETRGLHGEEILKAVAGALRTGRLENPCRGLCRNPESGEWLEYPLDPFLVRRWMREAGFEVRLESPHTGPYGSGWGSAWKPAAAGVLSACPWVLPWASPVFAAVGRKR